MTKLELFKKAESLEKTIKEMKLHLNRAQQHAPIYLIDGDKSLWPYWKPDCFPDMPQVGEILRDTNTMFCTLLSERIAELEKEFEETIKLL